jgi:hypothetical protein
MRKKRSPARRGSTSSRRANNTDGVSEHKHYGRESRQRQGRSPSLDAARFGQRRSEYVALIDAEVDIDHPVYRWADNNRAIFQIERTTEDGTWRFIFTRGDRSCSVYTKTSALTSWWVFRRHALLETGHDLGIVSDELWRQLCAAALREMRGDLAWFEQPEVQS